MRLTGIVKISAVATQFVALVFLLFGVAALPASEWVDSFYSFRVPIRLGHLSAGQYTLELTPQMITQWINEKSDFQFKADFFNYNHVKLVEVDETGTVVDRTVDAGYRIVVGKELLTNGDFEKHEGDQPVGWNINHEAFQLAKTSHDGSWCMTTTGGDRYGCSQDVPTKLNTFYHFSYWFDGGSIGPYRTPQGGWWRAVDQRSYYDPYTQPGWSRQEYYFYVGDKSDWESDQLQVRMERYTGSTDNISLRECEVAFVLNVQQPGVKRYLLYYAPLEGVTANVPSQKVKALPKQKQKVERAGPTEALEKTVLYSLAANELADVWYASSMRKVLQDSPPPTLRRQSVSIAAARNESEALQIVLRPKADGEIKSVRAMLSGPAETLLTGDQIDIRRAHYVPIKTPSDPRRYVTPKKVPDPLPKFAPFAFRGGDANILLWVDISVPKMVPAGIYKGEVVIETNTQDISIPLKLTVWDFTLPDRSTCRTSLQLQRYGGTNLFPYHKVTDRKDKYHLQRAYYSEMARYKVTAALPHTAYSHDPSPLPPPPARYYQREVPWALDELHMNGFMVGHYSGNSLENETVESARETAEENDRTAALLARHGWLDRGYILIDEPQGHAYQGVRNWIQAFRNQPHAKDIKMLATVYSQDVYDGLGEHLDIICPENNDNASFVSATGRERLPPGKEVWYYYTWSAHWWTDAPGIDQRLLAPKVWWMNGTGFLIWAIVHWDSRVAEGHSGNPWEDPDLGHGNGTVALFYPPSPLGMNLPEKDMTVVPTIRLVMMRDGIEDFEYATILERLIKRAKVSQKNRAKATAALDKMRRQFSSPRSWTLSEAHWQEARESVALAILDLQGK